MPKRATKDTYAIEKLATADPNEVIEVRRKVAADTIVPDHLEGDGLEDMDAVDTTPQYRDPVLPDAADEAKSEPKAEPEHRRAPRRAKDDD